MKKSTYSLSEVAKHASDDDCWVVVHGKVYDVSVYMTKHPGGKNLIFRSAGLDVSKDFEAMFHSVRARKKLDELYVGDVEGAKAPATLSPWTANRVPSSKHPLNGGQGPGRGPYGLGPPQSVIAALPASARGVTLTPDSWTNLTVVGVRDEAETGCRVLTFSLPNKGVLRLKPSQHVRVRRGKDLVRKYTPVAWKQGSFELLIKPYAAPAGVMSRHLCSMKPGDEIELSGPHGEWQWERKRRDGVMHLVLCGMGTGLTPLVQLLHSVQELDWARGKKIRISLLLAFRSESDQLMTKQIQEYEALSGGLLTVCYVFSSQGERLSPAMVSEILESDSWLCVCGTDEFAEQYRHLLPEDRFHAF